ncbi:hypothetical protein ASF53_14795 [Methylobacterium sp. Leaf123]|uniref:DUF1285 domain-containing protein n=1 Tax=Methylobacterium sp. Leaf123 TaxID=1736264 RepID=UPI0006F796D9|nr:DUF1285 domain-containing protein [Methylobacterium sp. Leaf123]KQQ11937.1 hypothetical protein ASF53_14795 [Methylobacterium sp. Leaf123]
MTQNPSDDPALARLSAALGEIGKDAKTRGLPPVERWNPEHCGEIDIRIAADGTWFHDGSAIRRPKLVKLFASILRKEPDGSTVLVTPAEKVRITVEDAAFTAVEMAVEGEGEGRRIAFRTNVDDLVPADAEHRLRFEDGAEGLKPYLHVRRDLWALVSRPLTYDLVAMGEEHEIDGQKWFGLWAGGHFHPIAPAEAA